MNGEEQGICAAMIRPVTNLTKHSRLRSELPKLSQAHHGKARAQTALGSVTACLESKELHFSGLFHVKKPHIFHCFRVFTTRRLTDLVWPQRW